MRILLVEDETELATTLERILQKQGYQVKTCGDGKEALDIIREGVTIYSSWIGCCLVLVVWRYVNRYVSVSPP